VHCWARYLLYAIVVTLGLGQMLGACGQKGDLYLPERPVDAPRASAPPPASEPSAETLDTTDDAPSAPPTMP
jgi:predicted small lipoprotein YifL